jgi:hypothetical protein
MSIPILRVRDANGNYVNIPAIQGPPGKGDMEAAAYDADGAVAQAGGIAAYVVAVVGDIDTVLDDINGEVV